MKTAVTAVYLCVALLVLTAVFARGEEGYKVSIVETEFVPADLQENVPFEINFKFRNTGSKSIAPFAEVTLSGQAYDSKGDSVLRIIDKKFRVYNFWPGDTSGKQRFYIGNLQQGRYTIKILVNTYDRTKSLNLCRDSLEFNVEVK